MKSELIVDVQPDDVAIALLEEGRLVSLQKEARNIAYAVGDIYLAKVKKLMPGLNAAFVNVGYEKDAFLHYLDLGPNFASYSDFVGRLLADKRRIPSLPEMKLKPEIDKHGSITEVIESGRELLVQIVKEPISSKGPRLTTEISFTGRYLVLTPFCDKISISQKIKSSEEKMRLRGLIQSIKPRNFGVIVRTSAEGKKAIDLTTELRTLVQAFDDCCAKAQKATAPALVFEEESRIVGMLRDVFNPDFESIHVNDENVYSQIRTYVSLIAPERTDIVKLYTKAEPIFDHFSITRQIKSSFGKTVSFKNGAYIIIEHTEALHVIDVNSGNRTKPGSDQESNALEVNLRAADEIARQLRLRDMGGIIVVDFIDMAKAEHRQELYDHMREIMANDRARHNILPLSKFGLMQITRQRVRPALDITVAEKCPSCFGKGEVQPSILFPDLLFEKLNYITGTLGLRDFVMYVHPFVDAYIKKGFFFTTYRTWRRRLGGGFKILPDESLAYLEYKVLDKDRNVLQLREEKDFDRSSATKTNTKSRRGDDEASQKKKETPQPQPKAKPEPKAEKPKTEKPKTETNAEKPKLKPEKPKTETNAEKPKLKQEKPKTETKAEKPKAEIKAEKPKTEPKPEKPKAEKPVAEPKAERKPRENKQPVAESPAPEPAGLLREPRPEELTTAPVTPAPEALSAESADTAAEAAKTDKKPRRRSRRRPAAKKTEPAATEQQ